MVHITRLTDALKRCLWRQGFVQPEALTHTREPNGDHRFTVVIPRDVCEYEPPTARALRLRARLLDGSDGRPHVEDVTVPTPSSESISVPCPGVSLTWRVPRAPGLVRGTGCRSTIGTRTNSANTTDVSMRNSDA